GREHRDQVERPASCPAGVDRVRGRGRHPAGHRLRLRGHAGPGRGHHGRQSLARLRPDLAGPAHRGLAQGARPADAGLV
ncbi:MAG: hypothetical protein AVDCRST_MAG10-800, partial [uncultured Acidimicrobiales bacterium]